MLSVYKQPPPINFSGNPIILGVKDSGQLSSTTQRKGVVLLLFMGVINANGYYIQINYGQFVKRYYFGIHLPFRASLTLPQWANSVYQILVSDPEITERFNLLIFDIAIMFVENETQNRINITLNTSEISFIEQIQSSIFGLLNSHYIIISPQKRIAITDWPDGLTLIPSYIYEPFGEGVEVEPVPYVVSEETGISQTGDGSVYVDYDIGPLVREEKTGHFALTGNYAVYDLVSAFRFLVMAKRNGIKQESLITSDILVIDAKISKTKQAEINEMDISLWQYLINTRKFLTWKPTTSKTDIYQPERVYFPIKETGDYVIMVREYYTSGGSTVKQFDTFSAEAYQIVMFSAAFLDIRTEGQQYPLTKYEIWLENTSGDIVSEARTYVLDYTFQKFSRWWVFKNSLGMYDYIRTTGFSRKFSEKEKTFIEKQLPNFYTRNDRDKQQSSVESNYIIECNSGPMTADESAYFEEFINSDDVYIIVAGKALPVIIHDGRFILGSDMENINNVPFIVEADNIDSETVDLTVTLPVFGDFNGDFNEGFYV